MLKSNPPVLPAPLSRFLPTSALRILVFLLLSISEMLTASLLLDSADLPSGGGLATWVRAAGPLLVQALALFGATALMLSEAGPGGLLDLLRTPPGPWRWSFLLGHAAAMSSFAALCSHVFTGSTSAVPASLIMAWGLSGTGGVALLALGLLPGPIWRRLARAVGWGWLWGAAVAAAAAASVPMARSGWRGTTALTFQVVRFVLQPILPGLRTNPATADIGTQRFSVTIDSACSGYEGVGLFLAFSAAWLYFFRKEYRFPAALALIPAGALLVWILNALRIAALILIGHAGSEQVALGGFHSEAGWIAFLFTAILFCVLSRRLAWSRHAMPDTQPVAAQEGHDHNAVAAYLLPFLAILAASLVSRAASAGFEWLYPLRLVAAVAVLWYYRKSYKGVDWRFSPAAVGVGLGVAALWVWMTPGAARAGLPEGFAAMPGLLRVGWVVCRLAAAVGTVPVAEELAFRGYLLRRLESADFEKVSWQSRRWMPFVVSSLAFGLMHESRWLGGVVAGAAYALVQIRRGRLGDAIAAHAVTNAALAALVWYTGDWRYW